MQKSLHINTPLLESQALSQQLGKRVFLKMDALQPSGSFKIRGVGHVAQTAVARGAKHLVIASGGNSGLALAYAGACLKTKVTVVVPEAISKVSLERFKIYGAEVVVKGSVWDESHEYALGLGDFCAHPFDDPLVWEGHTSLVDELVAENYKPDLIIVSAGGGGLLCGVMQGLEKHNWLDVPVLVCETEGANSFALSQSSGQLRTLESMDSIATTLAVKTITPKALEWTQKHTVLNWQASDLTAVEACYRFLNDHRVLVEPACGISLASVYEKAACLEPFKNILVVVCGGSGVDLEQLAKWRQELA